MLPHTCVWPARLPAHSLHSPRLLAHAHAHALLRLLLHLATLPVHLTRSFPCLHTRHTRVPIKLTPPRRFFRSSPALSPHHTFCIVLSQRQHTACSSHMAPSIVVGELCRLHVDHVLMELASIESISQAACVISLRFFDASLRLAGFLSCCLCGLVCRRGGVVSRAVPLSCWLVTSPPR